MDESTIKCNRKLNAEEVSKLNGVLQTTLQNNSNSSSSQEDLKDLLEYLVAMVSNGKTIEYIKTELISMEMDTVCDIVVVGNCIKDFIGGMLENEDETEKEEEDDSGHPRMKLLKSKIANNALTQSGALGSSRIKSDDKPPAKKAQQNKKTLASSAFQRLANNKQKQHQNKQKQQQQQHKQQHQHKQQNKQGVKKQKNEDDFIAAPTRNQGQGRGRGNTGRGRGERGRGRDAGRGRGERGGGRHQHHGRGRSTIINSTTTHHNQAFNKRMKFDDKQPNNKSYQRDPKQDNTIIATTIASTTPILRGGPGRGRSGPGRGRGRNSYAPTTGGRTAVKEFIAAKTWVRKRTMQEELGTKR